MAAGQKTDSGSRDAAGMKSSRRCLFRSSGLSARRRKANRDKACGTTYACPTRVAFARERERDCDRSEPPGVTLEN